MNYFWNVLVMINIYAILAMSLNLAAGYTGLLSLCQAGFYGIGAYVTTLLMVNYSWNFFPAAVMGIVVTAILSFAIAWPSLRLHGDYFVLATLAFQVIIFSVLYNWTDVTRGPFGIPGIPIPALFGFQFDTVFRFFLLSTFFALFFGLLLWFLVRSPFGRLLRAIREDELAIASLGKNVPRLKTWAFVISASIAAVPGALFAGYMRYIDPTSFTLMESIFILSIVIIGGAGSFWGPILGAIFLVLLPEALRSLHISDVIAANLRQIIYGLLLVILMLFRPEGIVGENEFT